MGSCFVVEEQAARTMKIMTSLFIFFINEILTTIYEPEFDYEDLDYYEYKEYVSNGWLDPNFFVEKNEPSTKNKLLDGYQIIDERVLIPNVRVGYLPIKEMPLIEYE